MKRPSGVPFRLVAVAFLLAAPACLADASAPSGEPHVTNAPDTISFPSPTRITRIAVEAPDAAELREIRTTTGAYASPWLLEVLKLTRSGVEAPVIEAFIRTAGTFNLTPKLLIFARDAGVSADVLTAMLNHDADLAKGLLPPPNAPPLTAIPRLPPLGPNPPNANVTAPEDNEGPALSDAVAPDWTCPDIYIEPPVLDDDAAPVRQPYPVRLTDTIRVFRGTWRPPNVQIIWMFPGARAR
jgi:hypothetical protein